MKFELAKVEQWNLGLSAGAVAASYALATPHFAISLAAGALLEAVNLGAIHRATRRLFDGRLMSGGWISGLTLRFLILGTAIFLVMHAGGHPVALLIGLSIAMPATLIDAWINRPPILDPATLPVFLDDELDEELDDEFDDASIVGRADSHADDEDEEGGRLIVTTGRLFPIGFRSRAASPYSEPERSEDIAIESPDQVDSPDSAAPRDADERS